AVESLVGRFERLWLEGRRPSLDEFLPAEGPVRRAALVELVHADLECRLKAGEPARVESYLGRYPDLAGDAAVVVELAAAEYEQRRRREPGLTPDELLQRFPRHRDGLRDRLRARPGPLTVRLGTADTAPGFPAPLAGAAAAGK